MTQLINTFSIVFSILLFFLKYVVCYVLKQRIIKEIEHNEILILLWIAHFEIEIFCMIFTRQAHDIARSYQEDSILDKFELAIKLQTLILTTKSRVKI